jgi:hypothetical protein
MRSKKENRPTGCAVGHGLGTLSDDLSRSLPMALADGSPHREPSLRKGPVFWVKSFARSAD